MIKEEEWEKIGKWRSMIEEETKYKHNQEELLLLMEGDKEREVTWFEVAMLGLFPFSPRMEKVLFTLVEHQDSKVRARALYILARKSTDPKIKELVIQALDDSDQKVILEALQCIREKREDWQDLSSQVQLLLQHPDDEIKVEALIAFVSLRREKEAWQEIDHLFQSFLQHPDRRIRIRMLSNLIWLYLENKKWKNMESFFKQLSDQSIRDLKTRMKEIILQGLDDPDPTVIVKILSIIDRAKLSEFRPQILKLLQHPNGKVRAKALQVFYGVFLSWKSAFIYRPLRFIEKLRLELMILQALDDPDEAVITSALSIIEGEEWKAFYPRIRLLFWHPNGNVRAKVLSVLFPIYYLDYLRSKWSKYSKSLRLKQQLKPTIRPKKLLMHMLKDSHESVIVQALSIIYDQLKKENRWRGFGEPFWRDVHYRVMPFLNHTHEKVRVEAAKVLSEELRWTKEKELIFKLKKYVEKETSDLVKFYLYKAFFDVGKETVDRGNERSVDCNKEYFKGWIDLIQSPSNEVKRMVLFQFKSLLLMPPSSEDFPSVRFKDDDRDHVVWNSFCLQYLRDLLQQQLQKESDPILAYFTRKLLKKVEQDCKGYEEQLKEKEMQFPPVAYER